jgi:hypothetical protein
MKEGVTYMQWKQCYGTMDVHSRGIGDYKQFMSMLFCTCMVSGHMMQPVRHTFVWQGCCRTVNAAGAGLHQSRCSLRGIV